MKSRLTLHAYWALAALAAFTIGSFRSSYSSSREAMESANSLPYQTRAASPHSEDTIPPTKTSSRDGRKESNGLSISQLFGSLSGGSIGALSLQAFRDPNPINRRLAFGKLLESLTAENALEIREQLVTLGASADQWRDFSFSWGALAGKDAFDFATTSEERDLASTISGWASANPIEAISMLKNLPEALGGQREELTESVISGIASKDPSMATDLVLEMAKSGNRDANNLIDIVARQTLLIGGLEGASRWSESLPDGAVKGVAMNRVAAAFVREDPVAASRWAQTHADQDYATAAIEEIGGEWAASAPLASVTWLESLPQGSGQSAGLRSAFGDWEDTDPAAAGKYLLNMPDSPQKDASISGFASGYAWQNPTLAIQWAESIRDPSIREQSLTRAGQAYMRREPEAARTWLDSSNLSPAVKQQILNDRR